jgi:8-oxo-dGTP diphosphatase
MENEFYKGLPKKRMAAGALFFNYKDEILIVKPSYKDHWSIPGGVIDGNESPRKACIREIKEELGLDIHGVEFLCVDYVRATSEKSESLQFLFSGGKLTAEQINNIKLPPDELTEYKFVSVDETAALLSDSLAKRIVQCLATIKEKRGLYLEDANKS